MITDSAPTKQNSAIPKYFLVLSFVMYLLACFLPAIDSTSDMPGILLLALGWLGLLRLQFAWFANLFLWFAWGFILLRQWKLGMTMGILGFCIGLNVFTLKEIPSTPSSLDPVEGFEIGVYLWFGSMVVVIIGAAIGYLTARSTASLESNTNPPLPTKL